MTPDRGVGLHTLVVAGERRMAAGAVLARIQHQARPWSLHRASQPNPATHSRRHRGTCPPCPRLCRPTGHRGDRPAGPLGAFAAAARPHTRADRTALLTVRRRRARSWGPYPPEGGGRLCDLVGRPERVGPGRCRGILCCVYIEPERCAYNGTHKVRLYEI
jgi:hypothetical protein